ncbi:glycosyltransferase, partial [Leclercia adecarboxylata]|uniref:glycosyltransferase n=1 Tax=Leclercia adecarboxylata TaxID=83655 RepID=UPI00234D78BE
GYLATPGSVEDFAGHVGRLIEDGALRQAMSVAARERSAAFSWDATMDRLLGYYQELLAGTQA